MPRKYCFVMFALLFISLPLPANSQAGAISQSIIITPENAHEVTLLAAVWHTSQYLTGSSEVKHRFSPDGSLLVTFDTGAYGSVVRIWNTETLTETNELVTSSDFSIDDIIVSPNNQQLLMQNNFFGFQWWDLATGKRIATIGRWTDDIRYSPDSRSIVTFSETTLSFWDASNGQIQNSFNFTSPSFGFFKRIAFSSDSRYVAVAADKEVLVWDVKNAKPVATLHGLQNTDYVSFSPDNTHIIAANFVKNLSDSSHIGIWDLSDSAQGRIFTAKIANASANGSIGLIQNDTGTEIIDLTTGNISAHTQEEVCYRIGSRTRNSNSLSPDGRTMVSCDGSDLKFIDTSTGTIRAKTSTKNDFHFLMFSPDSKLLATVVPFNGYSLSQCRLQLWDVQTGSELLNTPSLCENVTFSPDGSTITSMSLYGKSVLVLGIPDSIRPAYRSVPATVVPKVIAVRAKPSLNAETTGHISGQIVVSGIDPSGKFYYMESYGGGWINAGSSYVSLGDFSTKDQLHVREP